ncbi:MAG: hypothetical protein KGH53_03690, partial [Candidatus Micrarchaeota archaeon]|nr:hypothetical protein [Candidatus Micrarchaeota archaeon]
MLLIGYIFTGALTFLLASLLFLIFRSRKELLSTISHTLDKKTLLVLLGSLLFFLVFSLLFVIPTEQLYFDENIYQGIAINILSHGNALWCQYGTGFLTTCFNNALYHDIIG